MSNEVTKLIAANEEMKREVSKRVTTEQLAETEAQAQILAEQNRMHSNAAKVHAEMARKTTQENQELKRAQDLQIAEFEGACKSLERARTLQKASELRNDQLQAALKEHTELTARHHPSAHDVAGARNEWLPAEHQPRSPEHEHQKRMRKITEILTEATGGARPRAPETLPTQTLTRSQKKAQPFRIPPGQAKNSNAGGGIQLRVPSPPEKERGTRGGGRNEAIPTAIIRGSG